MPTEPNRPGDPYSRVEYRRLIRWGPRIEREAPFLRGLLDRAPERSVLDIGCGTGEHTAFFADEGCRAVGVDASESMIEAARDHERAGRGRFVLGDALELPSALGEEPPFGMVICLGNMLPHVREDADLARLLAQVRAALLPGGVFLIQILNYARLLDTGLRHLPVNFRSGEEGGEIVFLRVLSEAPDGRVLFFPTTLALDPDAEEPVTVVSSRRVELRAWRREALAQALSEAGFEPEFAGDVRGGEFAPESSPDLVAIATAR